MSMKAMATHITTWLMSTNHGVATTSSTAMAGVTAPPGGLSPDEDPTDPLVAYAGA